MRCVTAVSTLHRPARGTRHAPEQREGVHELPERRRQPRLAREDGSLRHTVIMGTAVEEAAC